MMNCCSSRFSLLQRLPEGDENEDEKHLNIHFMPPSFPTAAIPKPSGIYSQREIDAPVYLTVAMRTR